MVKIYALMCLAVMLLLYVNPLDPVVSGSELTIVIHLILSFMGVLVALVENQINRFKKRLEKIENKS